MEGQTPHAEFSNMRRQTVRGVWPPRGHNNRTEDSGAEYRTLFQNLRVFADQQA